jgi:hypothetical protein
MLGFLLLLSCAAADLLEGRTARTSIDGVMGGDSTASASINEKGVLTFVGTLVTVGGGFAYVSTTGGPSVDLTGAAGLLVEFESIEASKFGDAPIAFSVSLHEYGQKCALVSAFAVPTCAGMAGQSHTAWLPFVFFGAKANLHYMNTNDPSGPSICKDYITSLESVGWVEIGNYYQDGGFKLKMTKLEARRHPPELSDLTRCTAPSKLAQASIERATSLVAKGKRFGGSGVGIDQMNSMANAVLFTAAQQIGGEVLAAALQVDPSSSAPELTDKLMAAVEAGEGATDDRDDSADDSPRPQPDPEPRGSC